MKKDKKILFILQKHNLLLFEILFKHTTNQDLYSYNSIKNTYS